MVDVGAQPVTPVARGSSYVEWGAVIAGAVVASALSFVLLAAGTSVGLSLVSPYSSQSYGKLAAYLAAFWVMAVPILSLLVGGYIAGRMRAAWENATADEVEFRDGVHGLLVWAVSVVLGGFLTFLTAASSAQLGAELGKAALSDRTAIITPAVDSLIRPAVAQAAPAAEPATPSAGGGAAAGKSQSSSPTLAPTTDTRNEIARTLAAAVSDGTLTAEDKQYLVRFVSQQTGLSPAEAERRVDQAYAQAVEAVEEARKAAVLAGLATATALLLGLAAAWYAAQRGGQHRDQHIPAKFTFLRPRTVPPKETS